MLRRLSALRAPALVLAADLVITAIFFAPLLAQLDSAILADDIFIRPGHSGAFNFLWGYWWVQKAMALGVSPFHCSWILPPNGADLRLHTMPLLAAGLSYPLGSSLGPVAGYNLAVLGLIVGGALAAQWSLRRALGLSWPAALAAGALFGFAPYFVYKAHSHIHLIGAACWATALGQLLRQTGKTSRRGHSARSWRFLHPGAPVTSCARITGTNCRTSSSPPGLSWWHRIRYGNRPCQTHVQTPRTWSDASLASTRFKPNSAPAVGARFTGRCKPPSTAPSRSRC